MTAQLIPARNAACPASEIEPAGYDRHVPDQDTVETESGSGLEWQFGTCAHCAQSISRFRALFSRSWFDHWGSVDESAYLIENS